MLVAGGLAILAVVAMIAAIALFGGGKRSNTSVTTTGRLVVLDPGHGGSDTGALENGVAEKDVSEPRALAEAPGTGYAFRKFALSQKGDVAVILQTADHDNPAWFCCLVRGIGKASKNEVVKLPPPPIKYYTSTLMWSPTGELALTDLPMNNTVAVQALRNNTWTKIAEAGQPLEAGDIFRHCLFFTTEGVPIVTWEDFFPR